MRLAGIFLATVLAAGGLDLQLKNPRTASSIEGTWTYAPLDGGPPYQIQIRKTEGGFYEFEGRREGIDRAVLQLDREKEGSGFRGLVSEGFDPCIGAGARFLLLPTADSLSFEPSLPVSDPFQPLPPGACTSARRYVLRAKGHGDQIRLKPPEELAGMPSQPGQDTPREGDRNDQAGTTMTLGAPTAPDGTHVLLLGSLRDSNRKLWHHVKIRGETPKDDKSGYVPAETVVVHWECRLER